MPRPPTSGHSPGASPGPRGTGWGEAGIGGLVSILMVVLVLGTLAAATVVYMGGLDDVLGGADRPGSGEGGGGPLGPTPAGLLEQTAGGAAGGGAATAGGGARGGVSPRAGATSAACQADYDSVQRALALAAASGAAPASVADLLAAGWLAQAPANSGYTVELGATAAGTQVLVNGQPGPAGCQAP